MTPERQLSINNQTVVIEAVRRQIVDDHDRDDGLEHMADSFGDDWRQWCLCASALMGLLTGTLEDYAKFVRAFKHPAIHLKVDGDGHVEHVETDIEPPPSVEDLMLRWVDHWATQLIEYAESDI